MEPLWNFRGKEELINSYVLYGNTLKRAEKKFNRKGYNYHKILFGMK